MNGTQAIARIEGAIGSSEFDRIALEAVSDVVGSERGVWMRHSSSDGATTLLAPFLSAAAIRTYAGYYARINPFVPVTVNLPAGALARTSQVMSLREYRRTEYYGWTNRTIGAYELALIVSRIDNCPVMVTFGRARSQGDFSRAQEDRLRAFAGHLRRAWFLHSRIRAPEASPFVHLLEHAASTGACFALGRDGALIEANGTGDLELLDGSTVTLREGRMHFLAAPAQRAFLLALRLGHASTAIALGASEPEGMGLLVDVSSLTLPAASRPAHWLLFVPAGHGARQRMQLEAFVAEHGLTGLESAVLEQLLSGGEVADIAATLGHAVETSRSVLKSLFRKTGTHRQAELVARALGAPRPDDSQPG